MSQWYVIAFASLMFMACGEADETFGSRPGATIPEDDGGTPSVEDAGVDDADTGADLSCVELDECPVQLDAGAPSSVWKCPDTELGAIQKPKVGSNEKCTLAEYTLMDSTWCCVPSG